MNSVTQLDPLLETGTSSPGLASNTNTSGSPDVGSHDPGQASIPSFLFKKISPSDPLLISVVTILTLLSVSGVLGNALLLYTTLKQQPKKATDVFITLLAVGDLLVCLVLIPDSISCLFLVQNSSHVLINQDAKVIISVHSAILMMCISFDRLFLAVSASFRKAHPRPCPPNRARARSAAI